MIDWLIDWNDWNVNSNVFVSASLSCFSHSIDICTVAIKNIVNMHAISTNQIADI